jgi:hypothetical protein
MQDGKHPPSMGLCFIGLAFPELRSLRLSFSIDTYFRGDAAALSSLPFCTQLKTLCLENVLIDDELKHTAATLLARLPALKDLTWKDYRSIEVATQLTGLTKLTLETYIPFVVETQHWLAAATRNPGLQSFRASFGDVDERGDKQHLTADSLEQLLTGCPELTALDFATGCVNQDGLDALLALGTGITHLGLFSITATEDRSDAAVKWEQLEVSPLHAAATAQSLAHLPLKTVQVLKPDFLMSHLLLPLDKVPFAQVPALLHKAATNLSACPA